MAASSATAFILHMDLEFFKNCAKWAVKIFAGGGLSYSVSYVPKQL